MKPVLDFLNSPAAREWLAVGSMDIYVRRGYHYWDNRGFNCFDVASVSIPEEDCGKGTFTAFIRELFPIVVAHGFDALYVENTLNERLMPFLEREGYTLVPRSCPPCFYRLTAVA